MISSGLRRELSRRFYVRSRTARAAALRMTYVAYTRTLLNGGGDGRVSAESIASLRRRMEELFDDDWRDAEEGIYPRELIESLPWREYAQAAPLLLADLPRTRARMMREDFRDVPEAVTARYPRYYAQNFHYQSEGYLGHTSAQLYDLQVELLFGGTADAMRRRVLRPVVEFARAGGHSLTTPMRMLDVACVTGHLLGMLGAALPDARLTGLDLSPHYLARAREMLSRELDLSLVCDNAEKMPFVDGRFDVVTSVYLFHELPHDVRAHVLSDIARVLRPGGLAVIADSIQLRDAPELEREILAFPARFHEPYYKGFVQDDLAARVGEAGLEPVQTKAAFLTKMVVARKPAA
jgi:ubiquinone/menaquinone biosynthesis C-methylase UbiE